MWWQVGRLMLAVLLGQVALGAVAAPSKADPASDARTLYCLEPANARPLADAAVKLDAARAGGDGEHLVPLGGGRDLTVAEWSDRDPRGFARACAALAAARELPRPASSSPKWRGDLVTGGIGLVAVVVGAALAFASTTAVNGRAAAERAAGDLHTAATGYYRACRACLVAWRSQRGGAEEAAMDAPLDAFRAELRRVAGRRAAWRRPAALDGAVRRLDAEIRRASWPEDPAERDAVVDRFVERLESAHAQALEIVAGLERPWRARRKMRRP